MIQSISLTNFQSHKSTLLNLDPGVNVIIGPSDSGKSAIIRALRWVMENRPAGDEFRSDWAGKDYCEVGITLDDHYIERIKGGSTNIYNLTPLMKDHFISGNQVETFQSFGQDVPPPISQALNLSTLNVQHQHDRPFLLDDSPGQVARTLNAIVKLDKIDSTLTNVVTKKKQVANTLTGLEMRLADLEHSREQFPDLIAAESFVSELEQTQATLDQVHYTWNLLSDAQDQVKKITHALAQNKLPDGVETKIDILWEKNKVITITKDTQAQLANTIWTIHSLRQGSPKHQQIISQAPQVELLLQKQARLKTADSSIGRLLLYNQQISTHKNRMKTIDAAIIKLKKEFEERMGSVCPLCEQEIK
jgi:DNA repair protein SbcC/Rad50